MTLLCRTPIDRFQLNGGTGRSQKAKRKSSLSYGVLTMQELELARQEVKRFTQWMREQDELEAKAKAQSKAE